MKRIDAKEIRVRRINIVSSRSFEDVVNDFTATVGRPDISAFHKAIYAAGTLDDLEKVVRSAIGSSELMEFIRFDIGEVLRKEGRGQNRKALRLVIGNPLIMKEMVRSVPDAASYAPVSILIDERADGVHLSYDSMESLLFTYGSREALMIARDLDAKIEALIRAAAECTPSTES